MTRIKPEAKDFCGQYALRKPQILAARLVADLETPVGAYLKLSAAYGPGFLLESVEGGAVRGRYSILGFAPDAIFRVRNGQAEINREPAKNAGFSPLKKPVFEALRDLLNESRIDMPEDLPAMSAGIFGILGYDVVRFIEKIGADKPDPINLPQTLLVRPMLIVIFDSV